MDPKTRRTARIIAAAGFALILVGGPLFFVGTLMITAADQAQEQKADNGCAVPRCPTPPAGIDTPQGIEGSRFLYTGLALLLGVTIPFAGLMHMRIRRGEFKHGSTAHDRGITPPR